MHLVVVTDPIRLDPAVTWWSVLATVVTALALVWLVLVGLMYLAARRDQRRVRLREALRLLPDILRLLRRLASDPALPRGVRIRLVLLFAYLASPIDLVPDFIPVILVGVPA